MRMELMCWPCNRYSLSPADASDDLLIALNGAFVYGAPLGLYFAPFQREPERIAAHLLSKGEILLIPAREGSKVLRVRFYTASSVLAAKLGESAMKPLVVSIATSRVGKAAERERKSLPIPEIA